MQQPTSFTLRQRAWLGTLLYAVTLTLIIVLPNPATFMVLLVAIVVGAWLLMTNPTLLH